MKIIERLLGDQLTAQFRNTKFYLREGLFLFIKSLGVFLMTTIFFIFVFFILKPGPTQKIVNPLFEVLITTYVNPNIKKQFCHQQYRQKNDLQQPQVFQVLHYPSKLYTREQYCQLQHAQFPFQITRNNEIDIFISGFTRNVYYLSGCVIKLHSSEPICQKFSYQQRLQIFNNVVFEDLYAIEIQLKIKQTNQDIGNIEILFKQQNNFIERIVKEYYFIVAIAASLLFSALIAGAFAIILVPDIIQKVEEKEKKKAKIH